MNFIKLATILLIAFHPLVSEGEEEYFDLERIKLTSGKVYHGIQILEGDRYGLLFRHKAGIAKVPFDSLSMNLRMLYEPVEEVPGGENVEDSAPEPEEFSKVEEMVQPITWYVQAQVAQNSSRCYHGENPFPLASLGYLPEHRAPWRPQWGRYPLALSLANPRFRALAVQDFLSVVYPYTYLCGPKPYAVPLRTYYAR